MAKFNREKVLKQLEFKRKWRSYSRYVYIAVPCVLCCLLCLYFAYSKFFVSREAVVVKTTVGDFIQGDVVIGAYIDNEYSSTIPGKDDGYVVEKVVCDNDATGEWDNNKWGLLTTNLTKRTKCNVYFHKDYLSSIIAQLDTSGKCPTVNDDGSVSVTGVEATDGYLCKAKDAYGDSYYYRGNVTNNYVRFGTWSSDTPTVVVNEYGEQYDSLDECKDYSGSDNCTELARAGKDMYWRIVRINGDGTVRAIYDGTSAHSNDEASADRQIGTSAYNYRWKKDNVQESAYSYVYNDNAGVGYMYGNRDGMVEQTTQYSTNSYTNTSTYYIAKEYTYNASTDKFTLKDPIGVLGSAMTSDYVGYYTFNSTSSSSSNNYVYKITSVTAGSSKASVGYKYVRYGTTSKEKAQTNTNDSTIKEYLDNWYKTNIVGTTNEQYLADNIFCNDRSMSSNLPSSSYNNLGYGFNATAYRWYYFANTTYNKNMILTCPQQNDAFTVSDTTNGNGALTYPVGLLSTDEIVLAGGWSTSNSGYYLYSGQYWWASSPGFFYGNYAGVRYVYSNGNAGGYDVGVDFNYGVRPVFNLKAEVLAQGSGTAEDPFHISS